MSEYFAWDVETWSPKNLEMTPRSVKMNPENNRIIAIAYSDENHIKVIQAKRDLNEHPEDEKRIIYNFKENCCNNTTVGFNIFRYDIPTLFYRAKMNKIDINLTKYRHIDPFWLIPFWLHNTNDGERFLNNTMRPRNWGNFWNLEKFSQIFLKRKLNKEYSGNRIRTLYERGDYDKIKTHVAQDVEVLMNSVETFFHPSNDMGFHLGLWELLIPIAEAKLKDKDCDVHCPFMQWVPDSMKTAIPFCSIQGRKIRYLSKKNLTPQDIITLELPPRESDFRPLCKKR